MYFPVEWSDKLSTYSKAFPKQISVSLQPVEALIISDSSGGTSSDPLNNQASPSSGGSLGGVDQDKWGDLIQRLENNTGFKDGYIQTYEDLIKNSKVGNTYIHRDRKHEDIVIKEVFPTIHNIDQSFEDILKAAPDHLSEFDKRNDIIEQYRSQNAIEKTTLKIDIISKIESGNLGPLEFPPSERQAFFDKTLTIDKSQQLSDFITQYFQYDPDEGDLPIATRELYSKNLERLLYSFSKDPTYAYLDFYLENLNKEYFLHNALNQASSLHGSKTATELLFAIERIYEIQQRAWTTYFKFKSIHKNIPQDKKNRLRVETLRRVNERYKEVLQEKEIENIADLEKKYRQRRYEIIEYIIKNTPDAYRLQDALFDKASILWEMGLKKDDKKLKLQAINQWQSLINDAKQNNFPDNAYYDYSHATDLKLLDALLSAHQREYGTKKEGYVKHINNFLLRRHSKRLASKREREKRILWPE